MLMPSIFKENFMDDIFRMPERFYSRAYSNNGLMQTDVKEFDDRYDVTMNLPGFNKEDIKGELKDGYLVVSASVNQTNDEKDKDGKFIRRERYSGSCSRSFYVGENVAKEDIKAKFEDGVLKLTIPKKEEKYVEEEPKYISIEG